MQLFIFLLIFSSLQQAIAADAQHQSEEVESLVAKMIAAGGGEKVVEGMTTLTAAGSITAFMRQDTGTYELTFKRPRKLRVETRYTRSFETRILNGNKGYRGTDMAPLSPVTDHRLLAMVYQYKHQDLLYGLLHRQYAVARSGTTEVNGSPVVILHLSDQEGPEMDVAVDAKTFLIVKVSGIFTVAEGRTTALASEFTDYRNVSGLTLPFRIVNYAGGQKIAETVVKTYRVNPPISNNFFAP